MRAALLCGLDVAIAVGLTAPVFVHGNIGGRAARRYLKVAPAQVVDVCNEWGLLLASQHRLPTLRRGVRSRLSRRKQMMSTAFITLSSEGASLIPQLKREFGELDCYVHDAIPCSHPTQSFAHIAELTRHIFPRYTALLTPRPAESWFAPS